MSNNDRTSAGVAEPEKPRRKFSDLPAAAQRALREAEQRRVAAAATAEAREIGGRGGKDPARYGDWEIKGIACDF